MANKVGYLIILFQNILFHNGMVVKEDYGSSFEQTMIYSSDVRVSVTLTRILLRLNLKQQPNLRQWQKFFFSSSHHRNDLFFGKSAAHEFICGKVSEMRYSQQGQLGNFTDVFTLNLF